MSPGDLADRLAVAVAAGDADAVLELVSRASEKERRGAANEVDRRFRKLRWGFGQKLDPKRRAVIAAWLGTATARQVASEWWSLRTREDAEEEVNILYDVVIARGRPFVETVVRNTVDEGVQSSWRLVRRAVKAGVFEEPDDPDAYARGMAAGLGWAAFDADGTYRALLEEPELLEHDVWQLFEVDCSGELTNAKVWETDERGLAVGPTGENRWHLALLRLAGEGRLDRQRLLDSSLDALLRDFRPSLVGWYAKLHEALEPTEEERRLRLDTYLSLLASPAPAAIKEGLTGLRAVEDAIPPDDLARAAAGPLAQKQKNLTVDMLRLLERAAQRRPQARAALLDAAAAALGHERPDVQERALALLERYADEAPRGALLALAEAVAPQLRGRVEALTGIAAEPADEPERERLPAGPWPEPRQPEPTVALLRSEAEPLAPVASVDELVELAGLLLAGQGSGDDVERLLDGVSRLCDERPQGFERATAALRKRLEADTWWQFGSSGVDAVTVVVRGWVARRPPSNLRAPDTVLGLLAQRAIEVAARASKRNPRPLLSFPTHAGGWIDPDVLADRERHVGRVRNRPDAADRLQARLRAFPDGEPVRYAPRVLERRVWHELRRLVVLEPVSTPPELADAAERVAAVGTPAEDSWLHVSPWGSWDALGARWAPTALPSFPEVAFAGAASLIAGSLDASPQLYPEVTLAHALDRRVPLRESAWLAIGGALVAKSPDLQRVATDVLLATIDDGRYDPDAAAGAIAWLVGAGFAKVSRLEAPLRDAGRLSALHAAQAVRLAEALLASLRATPHGLHAPLEVAVEHALRAGRPIERDDARAALERIAGEVSASSKLGRLARALLDLAPAGR